MSDKDFVEEIDEVAGRTVASSLSDVGKRVDAFLAEQTDLTRSAVVRLIESGAARVNGAPFAKNYKLRAGDVFTLDIPDAEPDCALPENIPIDVVYEDADIIVVNKPKGMVVHPAAGNPTGTLVNALLYHCKGNTENGAVSSDQRKEDTERCIKRRADLLEDDLHHLHKGSDHEDEGDGLKELKSELDEKRVQQISHDSCKRDHEAYRHGHAGCSAELVGYAEERTYTKEL